MQPPTSSPSNSTRLTSTLRTRSRRIRPEQEDRPLIDLSPSQPASGRTSTRGSPSRSGTSQSSNYARPYNTFSTAWSNSVSAIQGLTTNVLGSDGSRIGTWNGKRSSRSSSPYKTNTAPLEWGPSLVEQKHIGAGSQHDRAARAMDAKRRMLLSSNGFVMPDSSGRHKRRTSDDIDASSYAQAEATEDALVFIHTVRVGDTLAGLTIKYNCQAAVIRKANRMWPNDPIQSRKIVMIPADECGIKGKKVPGPEAQPQPQEVDLLGDETITMHESPVLNQNGWSKDLQFTSSNNQLNSPSLAPLSQLDAEPPWKHESWVLLPNDTTPTEIVRLSRSSLGYFPRARRKSNTFSDISTSRATSFDLQRPNPSSPLPQSPTRSPTRTPPRTRPSTTRARSSSNSLTTLLSGPGGVGTLGRHVRAPGPGPERLSEFLAPNGPAFVAPPSHMTVFTPWTPGLLDQSDPSSFSLSSEAVAAGVGMDFQDVGGAIEKWVRRAARKAASALETTPNNQALRTNAGAASLGAMGGGMGDLIELVDAFEVGDESGEQHETVSTTTPEGAGVRDVSSSAWDRLGSGTGEMRGRRTIRGTDDDHPSSSSALNGRRPI